MLIIEDCSTTRDALIALLQTEGAEVIGAGSGCAALDEARRTPFDVVLSDLGLPDVPGDLVIRAIVGTTPAPRVVAMTGFGEPHTTRAREAGAETVLPKPLDWFTLRGLLEPRGPGHGLGA